VSAGTLPSSTRGGTPDPDLPPILGLPGLPRPGNPRSAGARCGTLTRTCRVLGDDHPPALAYGYVTAGWGGARSRSTQACFRSRGAIR
jgi:hypothetical protein